MTKEERYAKAPLLYINQPRETEVKATMQSHYRSAKVKKDSKQEAASTYKNQKEEREDSKEKGFQEMTVEEQLTYLLNKPDFAPQYFCEFKTKERTYRGTLLSDEDDVAKIRVGRRIVEVLKENIEGIRLLSL